MQKDLLILKKKIPTPIWKESLAIKDGHYQLGQTVTVPSQGQIVIAEFSVEQTLLGKLMNVLYKPDELIIVVTLEGGENKAFRFVPGETELGIILSPLIENTNEFSYFYGDRNKLTGKRVMSFSILEAHNRLHWEQQYHVAFKSLTIADKTDGQP